jgi:hypothetical protein
MNQKKPPAASVKLIKVVYASYVYVFFVQVIQVGYRFLLCQCHHMSLMDFVVSPPGCGRSVTDSWGWDAHEAQLRCSDEVDGDIWIWGTRRGLKPKLY